MYDGEALRALRRNVANFYAGDVFGYSDTGSAGTRSHTPSIGRGGCVGHGTGAVGDARSLVERTRNLNPMMPMENNFGNCNGPNCKLMTERCEWGFCHGCCSKIHYDFREDHRLVRMGARGSDVGFKVVSIRERLAMRRGELGPLLTAATDPEPLPFGTATRTKATEAITDSLGSMLFQMEPAYSAPSNRKLEPPEIAPEAVPPLPTKETVRAPSQAETLTEVEYDAWVNWRPGQPRPDYEFNRLY